MDEEGNVTNTFEYPVTTGIVSEDTCEKLRFMLEQVVENGGGKNGYVEGFRVGGKTATSQTLPRGTGRYIASFLGFAPADDPPGACPGNCDEPAGGILRRPGCRLRWCVSFLRISFLIWKSWIIMYENSREIERKG